VVSPRKHGLSDYFGSGKRFGVNLTYVVQDERLGLANAVAAGEHVINGSSFAVVLGDNFFSPNTVLRDLKEFHEANNADATIGVVEVTDVTRHGIIKPVSSNLMGSMSLTLWKNLSLLKHRAIWGLLVFIFLNQGSLRRYTIPNPDLRVSTSLRIRSRYWWSEEQK
jgi:hypothetical protein